MTDWEKYRRSVAFYNKEEFIPRRDIRNTIADLVDTGDEMRKQILFLQGTVKALADIADSRSSDTKVRTE